MEHCCCCCSVTKLCPTLCDPMDCMQHARLLCTLLSPEVCSNSCPLSQWCYPTISSSVTPFSFCLQSFLAVGCFPMRQLFTSGGQSLELQPQHQSFQWIFRVDFLRSHWFDLLAVQGTLKSVLQNYNLKAYCSALKRNELSSHAKKL